MKDIAAGIVLYNPELKRLRENIEAIYKQVDLLILVDNASKNIDEIEKEYSDYSNIVIVKNKENIGIAAALNIIMKYGMNNNYEWMLTLDQDSVCPLNLIEEYGNFTQLQDVALISPAIVDRNIDKKGIEGQFANPYEFVSKCITSATLTKVSVWSHIGGFDEKLFIDLVDFEYCKRVTFSGYKIIRVNTVALLHEIGNITQNKFLFWKINVKNHSSFRKYYMARNILYCARKHKEFGSMMRAYLRIMWLFMLTMLYEKNKVEKGVAIVKGIKSSNKL